MRERRHSSFQDLTGRVFGHLTVVRETKGPTSSIVWLCRCPAGKEVVRAGSALLSSKNARCGRAQCECSTAQERPERGAMPSATAVAQAPPVPETKAVLDVERNRERYVRHKLHLRSAGLDAELPAFADLTCAECPEAPRCKSAFKPFNVNGECLESHL